MKIMRNPGSFLFLAFLCLSQSACGLLIGSVKPVAEKSDDYRALDLSDESEDWKRLEQQNAAENPDDDNSSPDLTYQSDKTASIISMNSVCRKSNEGKNLREVSQQLVLGFTEITHSNERQIQVDGTPALETTFQGTLNGGVTRVRTVVARRGECIYDLMFIAQPEHFAADEPTFSRFVTSLRLK